MFEPLDAATFAKALASDEGLRPPIIVHGLVRKTADAKVIEFTLDVITCHLWLKIPLDLIHRVVVLGKRTCHDHTHDFVAIQFKSPTNAEAQVFAALLQSQETPGSSPMSPLDAGPLPTAAPDAMHMAALDPAAPTTPPIHPAAATVYLWNVVILYAGQWVSVGYFNNYWAAYYKWAEWRQKGYRAQILEIT